MDEFLPCPTLARYVPVYFLLQFQRVIGREAPAAKIDVKKTDRLGRFDRIRGKIVKSTDT